MLRFNTIIVLLLVAATTLAQNVGIGTNVPNASAKLDIQSTDKGILIPRINIPNLAAAAPVTTPAVSLLVYNTNATTGLGYYYWDGTQWVKLLDQVSIDHDWYEVGTTTPPNAINDNIFTQGNVGIGTTTPDQRLEITGGGIQINGLNGIGFQGELPTAGAATRDAFRIYYDNNLFGSAFDGVVFEKTDFNAPTADGGIAFANMGNTNVREIAMVIRGNNRVGIGTTDPVGQLHILNTGGSHYFSGQLFRTTRLITGQEYGLQLQHDAARTYFNTINNSGTPTTQMVIQSVNGNIGMGTNVPTEKLDVVGSARIRQIDQGTAVTDTILVADTDGVIKKKDANSLGLVVQDSTEWRDAGNYIIARDAETAGNSVVVTDAGNMGVGTTDPFSTLHVRNTTPYNTNDSTVDNSSIVLHGSVASATGSHFGGITWASNRNRKRAGISSVMERSDGDYVGIAFWTQGIDGPGPMSESMRISHSGRVGIGTTAPVYQLHTFGTIGSSDITAPTGNVTQLFVDATNSPIETRGVLNFGGTSTGNDALDLRVENNTKMSLLLNGNVGIAITNPTYRLHTVNTSTTNQGAAYINAALNNSGKGLFIDGKTRQASENNIPLLQIDDGIAGGNNTAFWVNTAGNVGIGTNNPAQLLSIEKAVGVPKLRIASTAAGGESMALGNGIAASTIGFSNTGSLWIGAQANVNNNLVGTDADLTIISSGNVGIGTTAPTQRLHVIGNILASGTITSSDRRYKKNIHTLENALANVVRLRGVSYDMKEEHKEKGLGEGTQIGVIAQEVEKIYPELVITNPETGYKAVDYSKFTPILIQAIKEQQNIIDTQQSEQRELKAMVEQQQANNRQLAQLIEKLQLQVSALEQTHSASATTK